MKLTIRRRMELGAGIVFCILAVNGLISYLQVRMIENQISTVTQVALPMTRCAYELEINMIGTGMGVLKYLDTSDPRWRARVEEDSTEFMKFHDEYLRLAGTPEEKRLAKQLLNLFEEYKSLGVNLMKTKDDQDSLFKGVAVAFQRIDDVIDDQLQVKIEKNDTEKILQSQAMEADIAEVGTWLGHYLMTSDEKYQNYLDDNMGDVIAELHQLKQLPLTKEEKQLVAQIEILYNQSSSDIGKVIASHEYFSRMVPKFIGLRSEMDNLLDDSIQILITKDMNQAKENAHRAAIRAAIIIITMSIIGLVLGALVLWKTVRSITGPVERLVSATKILSQGDISRDFAAPIPIVARDELGELTAHFNTMTEALNHLREKEQELRNSLESQVALRTAQLQESDTQRKLVMTAIEQAEGVILITDADGAIEYVNPAFEHVTGYTFKEVAGRNPRILKSGKQSDDFYKEMWKTLRSGKTWSGRLTNKAKDGTLYVEEGSISPVFDAGGGGNISHYVTVRRDVTREISMENQLNQAQKVESIGRLAGGVAHDLNNLLTPILGYCELLQKVLDPDDVRRKNVDKIVSAGLRARDLVRQLLAFSRKQTLKMENININEIIMDFEKLLHRTIREDIEIKLFLSSDPLYVMADVGQIEQVVMNLAVNAGDAMPDGGKMTIDTTRVDLDEVYAKAHQGVTPGPYILMAVSDNGCGMDEEVRNQIFEPFFSTKGNLGTGLGLATVYGIVKQHGGNIWVYSEPGKGTTFNVYIPVSEKMDIEKKADKETLPDLTGTETILLAEDNERVMELALDILHLQGYSVITAENGLEALAVLDRHEGPVHLLLTDVVMPEMSGRELSVKAAEKHPGLKVLFMSGYTDNVIAHHGVLDQGIAFIQKPFAINTLAAKVREVLEQ